MLKRGLISRKGWMGGRSFFTLVLGLLLFGLGALPLLNRFGVIDWTLPFGMPSIVLLGIMTIGGAYLMIAGFMEVAGFGGGAIGTISIISGIVVAAAGVLKFLNMYAGILGFIQGIIINIIFVVMGILMILGAFVM